MPPRKKINSIMPSLVNYFQEVNPHRANEPMELINFSMKIKNKKSLSRAAKIEKDDVKEKKSNSSESRERDKNLTCQ